MKTLADLIAGASPEQLAARTRGSTTQHPLTAVPGNRSVLEFTPDHGRVPVARYFRVEAPEVEGLLGAVPFAELGPDNPSSGKSIVNVIPAPALASEAPEASRVYQHSTFVGLPSAGAGLDTSSARMPLRTR